MADVLWHLVLPAVTLGTASAAALARLTRSSVLEIIRQDYVRSARAKGLAEHAVIARHVLKNAINPIITVLGLQVGFLLGGAILTETVFSWPGLGSMMVRASTASAHKKTGLDGQFDWARARGTGQVQPRLLPGLTGPA